MGIGENPINTTYHPDLDKRKKGLHTTTSIPYNYVFTIYFIL
jgi:hypothetical protein